MSRVLPAVLAVVAIVGVLAVVLVVARGRDDPGLGGDATGGTPAADIPDRTPGSAPARDGVALSRSQWTFLVGRDNVVVSYRDGQSATALRALQREVAGPYRPALATAGQAVVLDRSPDRAGDGVQARGKASSFTTSDPADPALRDYVEAALGGAAGG